MNLQGDGTDRFGDSATIEAPRVAEARVEAPRILASRSPEPPAPAEKRRVLPSLLVPEPVEAEPELPPEPRLPRVRRAAVKTQPVDAQRAKRLPEPVRAEITGRAAAEAQAVLQAAALVQPAPGGAEPASAEAALARSRRERRGLPGLRAGERWKRRLPRSCW
ncbi:hypothetical protein [Methylobacterium planeticum]|uniref:Uncharacterized protein n=1 Tax=Methylobacterium planeticum TaxID=2615211 RepID=A0A6N6MSP0_9HYPH|nr:hypothetical protein [Methylobacterium planeticum]KAB1074301.1 hypothetical protein F6X51_07950 [Methylobacterium planeticum]